MKTESEALDELIDLAENGSDVLRYYADAHGVEEPRDCLSAVLLDLRACAETEDLDFIESSERADEAFEQLCSTFARSLPEIPEEITA